MSSSYVNNKTVNIIRIMILSYVIFPDFAHSFLSCEYESPATISVTWLADDNTRSYIISWYSVDEYLTKYPEDPNNFRNLVETFYEDQLNRYYGFSYEMAFEYIANQLDIQSAGYAEKSIENSNPKDLIPQVTPNTTYDITVRVYTGSSTTTKQRARILSCRITTEAVDITTSENMYTTTENSYSASDSNELDPWLLYIIIPGTILSLLTISLILVLVNRKWRMRLLRMKSPVRLLKSSSSSRRTVESRLSSSSSSSILSSRRYRKIGVTTKEIKKETKYSDRYKHYVITPPESWTPTSPSFHTPLSSPSDDSFSDSSDPFDRLHHRHSLTTVTEESDTSDTDEERRCARFSARTFDSRLTSRESSFTTYYSWTPNSHRTASFHTSNRSLYSQFLFPAITLTPHRYDTWTSRSNRYLDYTQGSRSTVLWRSEDENDYSPRETDDDMIDKTYSEDRKYRQRARSKRLFMERKHRRVIPSVRQVTPIICCPTDDFLSTSSGESQRSPGKTSYNKPENHDEAKNTNRRVTNRTGTPAVDARRKFTYESPNTIRQPPPQRSRLRATKSTRSIKFV